MLSLQLQLKTLLTKKQRHCNVYYNTLRLTHIFFYFYVVNFLKDGDRGTNESSNESGRSYPSYPNGKRVILFIPL